MFSAFERQKVTGWLAAIYYLAGLVVSVIAIWYCQTAMLWVLLAAFLIQLFVNIKAKSPVD